MDTNKNSKKIIILGIILLVIAGIIVVALKGFNVSLMFGKHEAIEIKVGTDVDLNVVNGICDEVFGNKKYVVKELEVFGDSAQINVSSITDEEKTNLVSKINEKFGVEKTVEDLNINSVSNKRIRDVVKPYVVPMLVSFAIIFIYMLIRFRKINPLKIIAKFIEKVVLIEAILLSIIAITRIPVNDVLINILMIIAVIELVVCISKSEDKLEKSIESGDK